MLDGNRLRFIRDVKAAVQHGDVVLGKGGGSSWWFAANPPGLSREAGVGDCPGLSLTWGDAVGFLLDLFDVPEHVTNDAIEGVYKALSDGHGHDVDGIWLPMDSPLLARMVELFTQRGLARMDAFRTELMAWASGARHTPGERIARPAGAMERWSDAERSLVKLYLEHLPPGEWTLDDHMLSVEFLFQRYLPADDLRTEAEWLSTKASIMGRVQASMESVTHDQADVLLAAMPSTVADALQFGGTRTQNATMEFARERCAENVRALSEDVRHRMRTVIAQHVEAKTLGLPEVSGSSLETKLLDAFGTLNRDWRRIAVTEAGNAQTTGYIASLPMGAKVKRQEQYKGACAFCRKIDGKVVEVVDPAREDKDPEAMIWLGKDNIGRSASPRKRVGDLMVEREPHEMWQIPTGLVHPHCRGRWVPMIQDRPGDDKDFGDWMRETLGGDKKGQS